MLLRIEYKNILPVDTTFSQIFMAFILLEMVYLKSVFFDVVNRTRMLVSFGFPYALLANTTHNFCQVLKLLKEKDADKFVESHFLDSNKGYQDDDDDDSYLEFGCRDGPGFAALDADNESISSICEDNDALSISSAEKTHHFKLRDFLNQQED